MADTAIMRKIKDPIISGFISGDYLIKEFLDNYRLKSISKYGNNSILDIFDKNSQIVGSNPYAVSLANETINEMGYRIANIGEIQSLREGNSFSLEWPDYIDIGFILKREKKDFSLSKSEPKNLDNIFKPDILEMNKLYRERNPITRQIREKLPEKSKEYLLKNSIYTKRSIMAQLKDRNLEAEYPVFISLSDLELKLDENSINGLSFKLSEKCRPLASKIFESGGYFSSKDIDERTGFPRKIESVDYFEEKGTDTLTYRPSADNYLTTGESCLSRVILCKDMIIASVQDLEGSGKDGRMVVIKSAQN